MKAKAIIAMITTKVKSILQEHADVLESELTVENAEIVVDVSQEAIFGGAAEGFKTWLQESETQENTIMHDGQKYQFNRTSTKEFQSPFGKFTLERRLYQNTNCFLLGRQEFHSARSCVEHGKSVRHPRSARGRSFRVRPHAGV